MPFKIDLSDEKTRYRFIIVVLSALLCISLIAIIVLGVKLSGAGNDPADDVTTTDSDSTPEPDITTAPEVTTEAPAVTTAPVVDDRFNTITLSGDEIYKGLLVLVNESHAYAYNSTETATVKVVKEHKSSSYKVKDYSIMLRSDVIVKLNAAMDELLSATKCADVQVAMAYTDSLATYDRATGLSFKLNAYDGKNTYRIISETNYEASSSYSNVATWLLENMYKYGFVLRYPEAKASSTGMSGVGALFRYVGVENAYVMEKGGYCLEEFVTAMKSYTYDKPYTVSGDGVNYSVYYVAATAGTTTEVNIPKDCKSYSVSGNNVDGFIVTVVTEAPAE